MLSLLSGNGDGDAGVTAHQAKGPPLLFIRFVSPAGSAMWLGDRHQLHGISTQHVPRHCIYTYRNLHPATLPAAYISTAGIAQSPLPSPGSAESRLSFVWVSHTSITLIRTRRTRPRCEFPRRVAS